MNVNKKIWIHAVLLALVCGIITPASASSGATASAHCTATSADAEASGTFSASASADMRGYVASSGSSSSNSPPHADAYATGDGGGYSSADADNGAATASANCSGAGGGGCPLDLLRVGTTSSGAPTLPTAFDGRIKQDADGGYWFDGTMVVAGVPIPYAVQFVENSLTFTAQPEQPSMAKPPLAFDTGCKDLHVRFPARPNVEVSVPSELFFA